MNHFISLSSAFKNRSSGQKFVFSITQVKQAASLTNTIFTTPTISTTTLTY